MRKLFFFCVLWALSIFPLFSNEAFYVYRNDGNFNGFFYNEVLEMRYSKFDLDSVEQEDYVVQDIVLADTIYRIPLAVIDSIGFQQPEIKLNPKAKFMERDGYCPYFEGIDANTLYLKDLPLILTPKIGDVIIGLPTDSIAEKYTISIGDMGSGSFSCVVTKVELSNGITSVFGHPVENVTDVFEQFITVEDIGVDKNGQVIRRVAGCTPDGLPRRVKEAFGEGNLTILDYNGPRDQEWPIGIKLSADLVAKFGMRASYNIDATHFLVNLERKLTLSAQAAIEVYLSGDFEVNTSDIVKVGSICFPPACPFLETNPIPSMFIRGEGGVTASFHFPTVGVVLGDAVVIDNNNAFPIAYTIQFYPFIGNSEENLLDISADLVFNGFLQSGISFNANIATSGWFKEILHGNLGMYLYCGPKVEGNIILSTDAIGTDITYNRLQNSYISTSPLSLDLEARAQAGVFRFPSEERTFFTSNLWKAREVQLYLAPSFDPTTVEVKNKEVVYKLHPQTVSLLSTITAEIGIFDGDHGNLVRTVGNWVISDSVSEYENAYTITLPAIDLPAKQYYVAPIVTCGRFGPYEVWEAATSYEHPFTMEVDKSDVTLGASDSQPQVVTVTTNAFRDPDNDYYINVNKPGWVDAEVTNIGTEVDKYEIALTSSGTTLFNITDEIQLSRDNTTCNVSVTKEESNQSMHFAVIAPDEEIWKGIRWELDATPIRNGDNTILISGSCHSNFLEGNSSISFVIEKKDCINNGMVLHIRNGKVIHNNSGYTVLESKEDYLCACQWTSHAEYTFDNVITTMNLHDKCNAVFFSLFVEELYEKYNITPNYSFTYDITPICTGCESSDDFAPEGYSGHTSLSSNDNETWLTTGTEVLIGDCTY